MRACETIIAFCAGFAAEPTDCTSYLLVEFEHAPMNVALKVVGRFVTAMNARVENVLS